MQEKVDTAAIFSKLAGEILEIVPPEGTNMAASFGHLGGGYDARYYGYMVRNDILSYFIGINFRGYKLSRFRHFFGVSES